MGKIYVDLGGANKPFRKGAINIDRKKFDLENFINADYLSNEAVDMLKGKLAGRTIDVLHSAYSLCFNRPEKLEEYLPKYFALMSDQSKFIINDFGPSEEVVRNHTRIDEMQTFFLQYFKKIFLTPERKVTDEDHFHWIIKMILTK